MFVFTLGKNGLRRLGAVAVAGVALAGAVFAAGSYFQDDDAAFTAAEPEKTVDPAQIKIENTEGLDQFFKAFGLEADLTDTLVDKVKIPKKWDESFSAFNTVVKESGLDLEKEKGKTVEKWMVLCPSRSAGDQKAYGVVLVHKQQPVGAYLVMQPSGEVLGLKAEAAAQTAAPLSEEEAAAASAEFGAEAAAVETAASPEQPPESAAAQETSAELFDEAALAELEAQLASAGAEPVE